jgi:hypothetical protein
MNYKEKITFLKKMNKRELSKKEVFFLDIPEEGVKQEFIYLLKNRWEWIPDSYIDFLTTFNGGQYDDVSFLGDETCLNGCIFSFSNNFNYFSKESIPIATDSAGDFFCLNKKGSVNWIVLDNIDSDNANSTIITNTFESFINNFCFGQLYEQHYGKNSWTDLIKSIPE